MVSATTVLEPITITAGVQPDTDATQARTPHYTSADKIRFVDGIPQKIGGWTKSEFTFGKTIDGTARSLFAEVINGQYYNVIGTNKKLYSLIGSTLTNITPFETSSTTIADSLDTQFDTLSSDPFAAVAGSAEVTVTDSDASRFEAGDIVYFSGATTFAGIPAINLNGDAIVRSVGVGTYVINVGVNATSTANGGGASVDRASGLLTVNATGHGQENGDRVKIENAADTGGILAAEINTEFEIRNSATNSFDVMTIGESTSSVTGGGGASTAYFVEIPDGALNEGNVIGYGAGLYGLGLYGTALTSSSARSYPRIWNMDRYGDTIIMNAGNQTSVYQWDGNNATAPALVANAPTTVNYAFISDNILVVFGESGVENRITGSDQNDITNWTSSSINQVFRDDIEGAGRLNSHIPLEDYNLIFTENKTYRFRYIGLPNVWEITNLDETVGIIAPMARASAKGMGFWMGFENFYMYRGGTVEVIPSNTQNQSTLRRYVFENINWGQKSKCFTWFNKSFNEVWFHYPSATSNECDRVAVVNILDFTWTTHMLNRTAAEFFETKLRTPRMINVGDLYQHENGYNDDDSALPFILTSNKRFYGKDNIKINAIIPDDGTSYDLTFTNEGRLYPQSQTAVYTDVETITPTTERIPVQNAARFQQYTWQGDALDQSWIMGLWLEEIQRSSPE